MEFTPGPCQAWITASDLACGEPVERASAARAASDVLFLLSGSQFTGECETTIRPGLGDCWCLAGWPYPYWPESSYQWEQWGHPYRPGMCGGSNRIQLGVWPVTEIGAVVIDGDTLPGSDYAVEDHMWLVRTDCTPWPTGDVWTVTFTAGVAPPEMGVRAAKAVACWLLEQTSSGSEECQLPDNVQVLTRNGVTVQMLPDDPTMTSLLGLREVDVFLKAYNPNRLAGNAMVVVPGRHRVRQVTFP